MPDGDQATALQHTQRLTNRRAADTEPGEHVAFGWQPIMRTQRAGQDRLFNLLDNFLIRTAFDAWRKTG